MSRSYEIKHTVHNESLCNSFLSVWLEFCTSSTL